MSLTVGSLFSGVGGLDLGLERAGMEVRWQCEIDPYCRKVLAKHWPAIPCYDDVRNLPDDIEPVDLICGGYPCQPFSLAGARRGEDDARHLWPAFRDTIGVLRPRFALLENVPGHLSLGFGSVLGDLASLGYDTEWTCIPAAAVGAPHLRWRLFVVAYPESYPGGIFHRDDADNDTHAHGDGEPGQPIDAFSGPRFMVPDADSQQLRVRAGSVPSPSGPVEGGAQERQRVRTHAGDARQALPDTAGTGLPDVQGSSTVAQLAGGRTADGAGWWDVEPDVGRVADGVPSRVDRLRSLGNAVVPQVAEFIGQQLMTHLSPTQGEQ